MARALLVTLSLLALLTDAYADEACAPLGADTTLLRCTSLDAVESLAAGLSSRLHVMRGGPEPLALYRATVLDLGARYPVTPVLFLGRPDESEAEATHFERTSTRGSIRSKLWANPARMSRVFWIIERRADARGDNAGELRHYVLRNGYLYTEDPAMIARWQSLLTLEALFAEPTVTLLRGDATVLLPRGPTGYLGPTLEPGGAPVTLRLFDRVTTSIGDLAQPSALDLESLRRAHGLARIDVSSVKNGWARVHAVTTHGEIIPGAVIHDGVKTRLLLAHEDRAALEALLAESRTIAATWRALRERPLGFDEHHGGGALAPGVDGWERTELPLADRAPWRNPARFMQALEKVPDRFHEGDVLLVDVGAEQRAWTVWQVDPIRGRPLALLDGAEPRPIAVVLDTVPQATLRGRIRRTVHSPAHSPAH